MKISTYFFPNGCRKKNYFYLFLPRSGPILNLTWDEFEEIDRTDKALMTTNHKTGRYYTVHIFIQPDQRQFLRTMKAKFIEEFNTEPSYIFASSVNKVETSISRGLHESFQELFGDNPEKVRYNANSIRKFWERLWSVIKSQVSDGITKAHFAQTAHSEKTARDKYLHRDGTEEERAHVLNIYSDRLANRKDDEDCLSEKSSEAPPDEQPDSDLEDESPELPVLEPSFQKVETVARFNLGRDSLQTSTVRTPSTHEATPATAQQLPRAQQTPLVSQSQQIPRAAPKRDSWNSPKESPFGKAVTKFQTSMSNFRVRKGLPEWSEDSKKACSLFKDARGTVSELEIKKRCEEAGIPLKNDEYLRLYTKIKLAAVVFRRQDKALSNLGQ